MKFIKLPFRWTLSVVASIRCWRTLLYPLPASRALSSSWLYERGGQKEDKYEDDAMQDVNCFIMPVGWSVVRLLACLDLLLAPFTLSLPLHPWHRIWSPLSFIFSSCFTCSTAASQQVNKFIVTRRTVNYLGQSEVKCSSGCLLGCCCAILAVPACHTRG